MRWLVAFDAVCLVWWDPHLYVYGCGCVDLNCQIERSVCCSFGRDIQTLSKRPVSKTFKKSQK
jgi:hypothetical protein